MVAPLLLMVMVSVNLRKAALSLSWVGEFSCGGWVFKRFFS